MATRKKKNKESDYKTIKDNPEVFDVGHSYVSDVKEHKDGSATIQLELTQDQAAILWDVCLRNAIVNGLEKIDGESAAYSEQLAAKRHLIDQVRNVMELITTWETTEDFDWTPKVAGEVQVLREMLSKIE